MKQPNQNSTPAQNGASPRDNVPSWTLPEELREYEDDDGHSGFLSGLIECFLTDTEERLRILRQAVCPADLPTLFKEFHAIKGSAGSLGAYDVAGMCREAEEQARLGLQIDYSARLTAIEAAWTEVRPAMVAYCKLPK